MLSVKLLSNSDDSIRKFLAKGLASSSNFDWASAYATHPGLDLVSEEFNLFLRRGGKSRAIFDLAQGLTDPEIIEDLSTIPGDSECKVFVGEDTTTRIFHHKFYNFYNAESSWMMLGSANFTKSGLTNNMESAVAVVCDADEDIYSEAITFFEKSIWSTNSAVSPLGNPEILEIYKSIYGQRRNFQFDLNKSLKLLNEKVTEHFRYTNDFAKFNPFIAYICGLICANSKFIDRQTLDETRTVRLNFQSQLHNRNSEDEGYICTRDDGGNLLGGIRLPQIQTQVESMNRLAGDLQAQLSPDSVKNKLTKDNRSSDRSTNFYMNLSFGEDSQLWNHVLQCVDQCPIDTSGKIIPSVPDQVLQSDDREVWRRFIAGYFDFRGSPTKGHRLPTGGLMRIGVQIDTQAVKFAEDLMDLLNRLNVQTNLNSGADRGRDHIIRIMPDSYSNRLFEKGYQRLMAEAYAEYNKSFG